MNHVVLSGILRYEPEIIYVFEMQSTIVRFTLDIETETGVERHKIQLSGHLAEYARDHLNQYDRVELTGRVQPRLLSYFEIYNELIEWLTLRKID